MDIACYPPQEPMSPLGLKNHQVVMARAEGLQADAEPHYGPDAYQGLMIFRADPNPIAPIAPPGTVVAMIHGGGWTNGYREWMAFMAPAYTRHGITFVSIGYRLAPAHVWPSQRDDVADAVAWLWREIAQLGGDPNRLYLGGHSAGGQLAAQLALTRDWQAPRGLPLDVLKGALPISGTYWFGDDSGLSVRPRFLGPLENAADANASPLTHLHPAAPPFLVAWGDRDFPHLIRQAEHFCLRLRETGIPAHCLVLPQADHLEASYAAGEPQSPYLPAALRLVGAPFVGAPFVGAQ